MMNGDSSSVRATRVTSPCVRTPYSAHQRPLGSVNRPENTDLHRRDVVERANRASDAPVRGSVASVMVPRVNAPDADSVTTP